LAAKKRLNKSQIRDDKFIDTVAHYVGQFREHQRSLIGGIAVVLILILAVSWGLRFVRESGEESRIAFSGALGELDLAIQSNEPDGYESALKNFETIRSQYGGKKAGTWALYYRAFCKEQLKDFKGALEDYDAYLAEGDREFALAAEQGKASCLNSMGKVRSAASLLEELAAKPGIGEEMARNWLYRASQIYLNGQYYDNAKEVLVKLQDFGAGSYQIKVKRDLAALQLLAG